MEILSIVSSVTRKVSRRLLAQARERGLVVEGEAVEVRKGLDWFRFSEMTDGSYLVQFCAVSRGHDPLVAKVVKDRDRRGVARWLKKLYADGFRCVESRQEVA